MTIEEAFDALPEQQSSIPDDIFDSLPDAMPTEQSGSDWLGVGDEVRGVSDSLARGVLRAGQQFNLTALRRQRDIPGEIAKIDQELQQAEGYLSGKTPHPSIAAKGYVTAGDEADYRRAMKKTLGDAERRKMRLQQELDRIAASLPNIKDEFQTSQEMIEQLPLTAAQQDFHKKETPWWKFFANPVELALTTTAESAPQMLPSMVAAPLGIGAVALAAGGSSFGAESSARVLSAMQESGVDLKNPDAVVAWLSDRAKSDPALAKADLAALGPATFDALSGGIAGRWLRGAGGAGAKKIAGAMAKESGAQMLAGGAGSVAGSALAGEDVDWKDVVLEMAAEIAPVEAVSNVAAENGYSIGHYLENRSFDKMSKEAANEEALRQSFARHGTGENLAVNRRQDQSFAQPTAAEAAVQFEPDDELSSQIRQLESDPDVMGHEIVGLDSDGNPKKEPRLKDMKKVRRLEALKALQQQGSLESKIQSELEALPGAEQDLKQPAKPSATNPQLEKIEIVSDMLASLKAEIERNQIEPKSPESSPKSSTSDEITGFDTTASQTTPASVATPAGAGPVVVDSRPASAAIRDKDTGEIWHGQPLHGMLHDQIPNRAARNLEAGFATKAGKFITAEATEKATGMASGEELFEMSAKELKAWFDVQRQQIGMDEDATPTQKAERRKDLDAKFARATSFKKTGKISAETQGDGRTAGKNSTQGGEHSLPASPGQISRTEPTAGGVGAQVEPSGTPTAATPPESALPAKPVGETSNVGQPTSSQNPSSQEVSTSGAVGSKFKPNAPRKSRSPFWVRPRADGVPDILDAIQELGGIAPLDSKAFGNWRDKFHGPARMLLRKDGRDADLLVDDLNGKHADANTPQTFRVNTVDELLEAISDASAKRDKLRATGGGVEAQADRFWSAIGSEPTNTGGLVKINADQLQTGDKFFLRGPGYSNEELEVRSVADGVVTLKDGKAFGWQEVPEGTEFWVQKKGLEMAQPPAQSQATDAGRTVSTAKAASPRDASGDPGALRARERLERDARSFTGDTGIQIELLGRTESVPSDGNAQRGFVGVQRLGELLGASVLKFRATTTGADGKTSTVTRLNGWTSPDGKYIFINENAQNPALVVFGHELVHSLKRQNPELYKQLEREVLAIQKDRSRYEADARTRKYTGDVSEEMVADYVATHFNDPTFLRDLAKRNPTLFKRVVNTLKRYLDAIIGKLKGARFEQGMITQAEQARETLLRVLDEQARGIAGEATETQRAQSEQAKADNEPFMAEESAIDRALRSVGIDPNAKISPAQKLRKQADALTKEAMSAMDRIPAGQPNLSVRDRNLRDKAREKQSKASDLLRQAEKLEASNATVTKAGMVDMPGAFMVEAHHGTPHEVDKFSTDKIGTGEGAQVYGWGLYFAENPKVAEEYADNLGDLRVTETGGKWYVTKKGKSPYSRGLTDVVDGPFSTPQDAEQGAIRYGGRLGRHYTVSLDVELEDLLDWDRPLSEQSPTVYEKISHLINTSFRLVRGDNPPAQEVYLSLQNRVDSLNGKMRGPKFASEYLNSLGIPGIRYLDQGSRLAPVWDVVLADGTKQKYHTEEMADRAIALRGGVKSKINTHTYNYVIFDESKIKITHKNGQRVSVDEAFMAEADEGRGDNASINRELNALLDKPNPTLRDHARVRELQAQLGQEDLFASAAKPVEQMEAEQARRSQKDAIATRQSKRLVAGPLESQQDAFEKPDQGEMFMAEADENNLVAIHNTTAEKLRHILKMGGLAVPSVAITRTDKGAYESFGDISLVGNPEMITPGSDTKVLNADAYSPRYPKVEIQFKPGDGKKLVDFMRQWRDEVTMDVGYSWNPSNIVESIKENGVDWLRYNVFAQYSMLRDKGLIVAPSATEQRDDLDARVREVFKGHENEMLPWMEENLSAIGITPQEKIFNGYTNSGNRRYLTHDLDTVVRIMKKGFRDAEGFDYGVGSVRATVARQFKTLKQIQASRGDITTKASMDAIKAEVDKEFDDLAAEALKYRDGGSRSSFAFSDDLKAMAEGGAENMRHLRQMYPNGEPFAKMRAFLDKLRTMPTHYFEAKIKRAVQLQEFSGAVVPDNTPADVIKALEKRGLEVKTYPKGDAEARRKAVQTVGEERNALFMAEASERDLFKERAPFADSATKRAVRSMLTGDPIGKDFKDAQSRYLGFQKYFEESLRLLITQARRRVHQEFRTTTERKAAMERLGDFWLGKIPVSDVGKNPETQLAAAKFREQLDGLSLTAAQNGMVPDRQVATWIGNTGEWLKRTYLAFDPTADWNYDMLNKRRKREPEIATIWNDAEGYLRRQNPQATDKEIEAQMRHLVDRREVEAAFVGVRQPTDRSAGFSVDTGSLIKRKDIPPALQAWMGVTKDPIARAQQSSKWISQFLARNLMQRELARIGLENGWFSHKAEGRNHVEIYPNTERLVPVIDPVTGKAVETPSGNVEAEYRNNVDRRHEPLHGLYTSPEMLAAMQQFDGLMNTGVAASARLTAVVPQTVLKGVGLWKMGKVALNPASYGVNSFGAVVMRLMAGAVNPIHVVRAVGAIASPRFTVDANSSQRMIQMRARYLMATKAGVIGKGIFTREIDASFGRESEPMAARRAVRALVDILRRRGAGGARKRFANAFMDILKIPGEIGIKWADDVARTSAFLDEFELSKKANPAFSQDQHADWAAERAGNIYQTYDNLPVAIRDLSNIGFLTPFISFKAEIWRNAAWIAHYGYKGIKSGNPALVRDGWQKLVGLTAMTLLPIWLAAKSRGIVDDDDEKAKRKIDALQRWFVPPWDRGELLVVKSWSGDTIEYIPMTYLIPTAQFSRIPFMVSQIPNNENPRRAINQLVQGVLADNFGGGPITLTGEVLFNSRGDGKQITKAEGWRGIEARAAYAWKSARPGVAAMADEWMKANSGELGYGGRKYTEEEIQAKMLGLRVRTVDTKQAIVSTLREFSSRWAGASSEASIQKSRTPNNTSKIDDATSYKAEKHAEIVKDYEQFLKDCNLIGFTESEVIRLGRDKDVSVPSELKKSAK